MVTTKSEILEIFQHTPCVILDSWGTVGIGANAHDAIRDLYCAREEVYAESEDYTDIEEVFLVAREPEDLALEAMRILRILPICDRAVEGEPIPDRLWDDAQAAVRIPPLLIGAMRELVTAY